MVTMRVWPRRASGVMIAAAIALFTAAPAGAAISFTPTPYDVSGAGAYVWGLTTGDLNGDGKPDIVTSISRAGS